MPKRITKLTKAQEAKMPEWADRWIEIGLRTGEADRERFEAAVAECYRFAGLEWHGNVVWVDSPLVAALAGPIADHLLRNKGKATAEELRQATQQNWTRYIGGQFWPGGWYWGGAWTSFFREVCGLELEGDLWDRARAYEATVESACWWWPHERFVIVSERPLAIHRELTDPDRPRGWGSHRLHNDTGPALEFRGWSVYSIHGVRVPERVVMDPASLTAAEILAEPNAEVRRVMIERKGTEAFMREANAEKVNADEFGTLWRVPLEGDEPLVMVEVVNATPEPDGSYKNYWLRVPPDITTAQAAVAWSFDVTPDEYVVGLAT